MNDDRAFADRRETPAQRPQGSPRWRGEGLRIAHDRALGELGTTLAHELNQPIAAIVNYAEAARDQLRNGAARAALDEALEGLVGEALRAGQIVRQLRSFVTRGELEKRPSDLTALIRASCRSLDPLLAAQGISPLLVLNHDDRQVFAEAGQIQQVIVNLVRNAVEAMATSAPRVLRIGTRIEGTMAEVSVSDTGCGIAEAMSGGLFAPFASGKADGMGMGLSICRTIVEAHGGRLRASTEDGMTCFRFTLPLADPDR